jgi:hypothetical protein
VSAGLLGPGFDSDHVTVISRPFAHPLTYHDGDSSL